MSKGCLFYGPPGTGKTSVCRWIADLLEGKVYLVVHDPTKSLFENFDFYMKLAIKNRPSIIILDDIDVNFHQHQIRDFLVKLDGVENKHRDQVCVIFTCNNLTNIPEALIRGSRIENCVEFVIPNVSQSTQLIKNKLLKLLENCEKTKHFYFILKKCENYFFYGLSIHSENLSPANIILALENTFRELVYVYTSEESIHKLSTVENLTHWIDKFFAAKCLEIKNTIQKSLHNVNEDRFKNPDHYLTYT
jgi:hypothetical protein